MVHPLLRTPPFLIGRECWTRPACMRSGWEVSFGWVVLPCMGGGPPAPLRAGLLVEGTALCYPPKGGAVFGGLVHGRSPVEVCYPPRGGERCLADLSLIHRLLRFGVPVRGSLKSVGVVFFKREGAVLINFDVPVQCRSTVP